MPRDQSLARKQHLGSADFRMLAADVSAILQGYHYALIGGLAVAYYANPPVTIDVDLLIDATEADAGDIVERMEGWTSKRLWFVSGRLGMPQYGMQFSRTEPFVADLDVLFTGDDKYLRSVVRKAGLHEVQPGLQFPVVAAEDLMVIKTLVGREKDVEDTQALFEALGDKLDEEYITRMVNKLL